MTDFGKMLFGIMTFNHFNRNLFSQSFEWKFKNSGSSLSHFSNSQI